MAGAGQAGCAIVDSIFEHGRVGELATPIAFNSTIRDLQNLSNIDREAWYGVTEGRGLVPGDTAGFEEQVTGGFGRDPQKADNAIGSEVEQIATACSAQYGDGTPPFAFLFLGLGGGTGCGIAPYIAQAISNNDSNTEIIAVGVLPNTAGQVGEDGPSATRQSWNSIYGLRRLEEHVDGIILVDNQRLAFEDAAEGRFSEFNSYVAAAIVDLISGPILERIDPGRYDDLDTPVIDLQDIVTSLTLSGGRTGYAMLGRAVTQTRSLPGYILPYVGNKSVDGASLSRLAVSKRSVENLSPEDAKKAIGQVRAPARYLTDDSYRIELSVIRGLLDSYCSEVNLGMTLTQRNLASFTTLLTYEKSDIPRIGEITRIAEDHDEAVSPL